MSTMTEEETARAVLEMAEAIGPDGFLLEDLLPALSELNDIKTHAGLWSLWEQGCLTVAVKDGQLAWGLTDKGKRLGSP